MTTALLIIDVQNAIIADKASPERQAVLDAALDETVSRLQNLKQKARAAGIPVILVQHDGDNDHRLATGTTGWALRSEIAEEASDIIVHKRNSDSFFETELDAQLKAHSVKHLITGGCMTQFCVDTTIRRAVSLGYDVTLIADGHTTADSGSLFFLDIIRHHNETLDGFDAGNATVTVKPASEITF
ncbi:cysteine hydrolase family protein [Pseudochrobactrum sp. sp1633]|uniref:cysteine hydrolase family protein n=1 Tax=Pseudochrobactrum sp. sp1633 TaxID=3036706 RepID=UPI0025A4FFBC|nr:cysteine hydrolase family protein [Pseudochrobactrum sp. sp1633]MDM8346223.1 cysteine hydrolase family protein [Pseudochrobactrum sp. sp1633]HWD13710.1 cysteine hydrolase family protein [Pseudochrobactrum sp.]